MSAALIVSALFENAHAGDAGYSKALVAGVCGILGAFIGAAAVSIFGYFERDGARRHQFAEERDARLREAYAAWSGSVSSAQIGRSIGPAQDELNMEIMSERLATLFSTSEAVCALDRDKSRRERVRKAGTYLSGPDKILWLQEVAKVRQTLMDEIAEIEHLVPITETAWQSLKRRVRTARARRVRGSQHSST